MQIEEGCWWIGINKVSGSPQLTYLKLSNLHTSFWILVSIFEFSKITSKFWNFESPENCNRSCTQWEGGGDRGKNLQMKEPKKPTKRVYPMNYRYPPTNRNNTGINVVKTYARQRVPWNLSFGLFDWWLRTSEPWWGTATRFCSNCVFFRSSGQSSSWSGVGSRTCPEIAACIRWTGWCGPSTGAGQVSSGKPFWCDNSVFRKMANVTQRFEKFCLFRKISKHTFIDV